jgi:ubiquinone/menaquinone biosynthesis C-methylase UbiE
MKQNIPMPPLMYQALVCGPSATSQFDQAGRVVVGLLEGQDMLQKGVEILDVGCGCGRLARLLVDRDPPIGSYLGFDRHKGMIDWCVREISSRDARFHFEFHAVKSVYEVWDDDRSEVDAGAFRFPYPADRFDSIVLASVFTHMPPAEVKAYLGEIARVMRPSGKALVSIFFAPGEVETRDDGVNVFHNLEQFLADVEATPLHARLVTPSTPDRSFSYEHNWYLLTRK